MTLVAEGLCEDQGKLRHDVEHLRTDLDRTEQSLNSRMDAQETSLSENDRDNARRLKEIERRLDALEAKANAKPVPEKKKDKAPGLIRQITILASIICATWIIVTLLNLIPH